MFSPGDIDLLFGDDTAIQLGGYCHPGVLAIDGSARLTPPPDALEALSLLQDPASHTSTETTEWVTRVLAGQIVFDAFSAMFFAQPPHQGNASEGFDRAAKHLCDASSQVVKATALQFKPEAPTAVTALAYIRVLEASLVKRAQIADATKDPSGVHTGGAQGKLDPAMRPVPSTGDCRGMTTGTTVVPHVRAYVMDGGAIETGVEGKDPTQSSQRDFSNVLPGMRWKPPGGAAPTRGSGAG